MSAGRIPFVDVDGFLAGWPEDRVVLIAQGSYSPDNSGDRYLIYSMEDRGRLRPVADRWLRSRDLAAVRKRAPSCRVGQTDAMFQTAPRLVWCRLDDDVLVVWRRTRRIAMLERKRVLLRRPRRWKQLITTRLDRVELCLSADWVTRSVRLYADDGYWDVARQRDPFARIDPTYDGINLMADTYWASCLAREIAAVTGLRLVEPNF